MIITLGPNGISEREVGEPQTFVMIYRKPNRLSLLWARVQAWVRFWRSLREALGPRRTR